MKKSFVLLIVTLLFQNLLQAQAPFEISRHVVAGHDLVCSIETESVLCWRWKYDLKDMPSMKLPAKHPRQLFIEGRDLICMIDDEGVKCFNSDGSLQDATNVPSLKNPRQVIVDYFYTCALDDNGVQCWPNDGNEDWANNGPLGDDIPKIPILKNPREINAFSGTNCALDDDGIKCWGGLRPPNFLPVSKKAHHLAVGGVMLRSACVIDEGQVRCQSSEDTPPFVPVFKNPRSIIIGVNDNACVVDDQGGHCWVLDRGNYVQEAPYVRYAQQFIPGTRAGETCMSDYKEIICWGTSYPFNGMKKWSYTFVSPMTISYWIRELGKYNQPVRARYFSEIRKYEIASGETLSWYLNLFLMEPAIESADSDYMRTTVVPHYRTTYERINQMLIDKKTPIGDSVWNRRVALKHIQAALSVISEFVSAEDKIKLQTLTRAVGVAFQDPSDGTIRTVLGELKTQRVILESLKQSKKTEFLVSTIDLAASWLEKWVK